MSDISVLVEGQLSRDHAKLNRDHAKLNTDHAKLNRDHAKLSRDHAKLSRDHAKLKEMALPVGDGACWYARKPRRAAKRRLLLRPA